MTIALIIMKKRHITLQDVSKMVHISVEDLENHMVLQQKKGKTIPDININKIMSKMSEEPLNDNNSIEDLENDMVLQQKKDKTIPDINEIITKMSDERLNDNISYNDILSILTEIRDYLKIIAEK